MKIKINFEDFKQINKGIEAQGSMETIRHPLMVYENDTATNAIVAYTTEYVRHQNLSEAVNANQRAVDLASELFTRGLANFLNVLDAERSLYRSEDELVQSERTVSLNLVILYKALGGGWEKEPS